MSVPSIKTDRLVLRGWHDDDLEGYRDLLADPQTMRWLDPGGTPPDEAAAWRQMAAMAGHWTLRGLGLFAAADKETGELAGWAGALNPPGWPQVELAWSFRPGFRGRGLATEAARAALAWMVLEAGLTQAASFIHPENERSIALARRLGQSCIGPGQLNGAAIDVYRIDLTGAQNQPWWPRARQWIIGL